MPAPRSTRRFRPSTTRPWRRSSAMSGSSRVDEDRGFVRREYRPASPGRARAGSGPVRSSRLRPDGWDSWESAHLADGRPAELAMIVATMVAAVLAILLNVQEMLNGRSEEHTSELQSRENLVC